MSFMLVPIDVYQSDLWRAARSGSIRNFPGTILPMDEFDITLGTDNERRLVETYDVGDTLPIPGRVGEEMTIVGLSEATLTLALVEAGRNYPNSTLIHDPFVVLRHGIGGWGSVEKWEQDDWGNPPYFWFLTDSDDKVRGLLGTLDGSTRQWAFDQIMARSQALKDRRPIVTRNRRQDAFGLIARHLRDCMKMPTARIEICTAR
jgi:hypothetical protein